MSRHSHTIGHGVNAQKNTVPLRSVF